MAWGSPVSLLSTTGSTESVEVVLRTEERNQQGRTELMEVGRVLCVGRLQASTTQDVERLQFMGKAVLETARFITDGAEFPGDHNAQIIHRGKSWDVIGTPDRRRASRQTSRDVVRLVATAQKDRW